MSRPFRFGIVAAQPPDAQTWVATARRVESLGYDILLTPDNVSGLSPVPALAAAAAVTTALRLGTYVLAAPYRPAEQVAWDAEALDLLSGGRFELGLGAGRPAAAAEAARLGRPFPAFAERVEQVAEAVAAVRRRASGVRVLVAGSGRRLLEAVAPLVETVALGLGPTAGEAALAEKVAALNSIAGDRAEPLEVNVNLLAVGEQTPPWLRERLGADVADLARRGSAAVLTGSTVAMADRLLRQRDSLGISYVVTNAAYLDALAPVVERLSGS